MHQKESGRVAFVALVALIVLGGLGLLAAALFRAGPTPEIAAQSPGASIGRKKAVNVTVTEPVRGLSRVRAELVQEDRIETLAEKSYTPPPSWAFWESGTTSDELALEIGRDTIKGLKGGTATLRVTAEGSPAWLRKSPPAVKELTFQVRLTPPSLGVTSTFHFTRQGGAEAVVYRVGESSVKDGVRAGDLWFPGYPLPGGSKEDRFALFAVPYDMADSSRIKLTAADDADNEAQVSFIDKFDPRRPVTANINLSDAFLNKVVPAIMSQTPEVADAGGLVENFLAINRDLRKANAEALVALASKSKPQFLWSRPFLPMSNAKVMAPFAEERTYVYQGRTVDHQVHLGFDLAATRTFPVPCSNDGVVAKAGFFGIYGNTVIVDHGYGLQTLYAHLSSMDVKEGQEVKRGDTLGRTGDTGLAAGDHLHFSILLAGQPVNPQEWWDGHWIRDRVARKLGAGFHFEE